MPEAKELQAGRELDTLLAEKVMGWRRTKRKKLGEAISYRMELGGKSNPPITNYNPMGADREYHIDDYWTDGSPGDWADQQFSDCPAFKAPSDWSPSTDIGAAWQVVEHFHGPASDFRCVVVSATEEDQQWVCHIGLPEDVADDEAIGIGETAPLAICRAAIKFAKRREAANAQAKDPA